MQKDSFIFFKDWATAIQDLPDEIRLDVYDAVVEYGLTGKHSELKPMAKLAFGFIKQTIDRNNCKYKEISTLRSENGKKGAAKRWQKIASDSKNNNSYDNDNDNDNDNENENEERKDKSFSKPSVSDVISYFDEKGYSKDAAITAFEYYDSADWKDSKGNRVRNWKQKMIAVWFKPENKKVAKSTISMY